MTTTDTTNPDSGAMLYTACPSWCLDVSEQHRNHGDWTAVQHDGNDYVGVTIVRDHAGPRFGPFLCCGEQDARTGTVHLDVMVSDTSAVNRIHDTESLRDFATHATLAATWVDATNKLAGANS